MPTERPTTVPKRKRPPFNPPRPRAAKPSSTPASKGKSKPTPQPPSSRRKQTVDNNTIRVSRTPPPASPTSTSPSVISQPSPSPSPSPEPSYILAEITNATPPPLDPREELDSSDPMIPPKLLTTLLHHHFSDEKTKIAKDANRVVAKYVDIFVREALARAAYERGEGGEGVGGTGRGSGKARLDSYLEVEDLEKLAPQMVLDF
ncbi:hypothetical protein FQN50_000220 [Emmonsiellopsis sp. PD_5]|nr:hypothetical protein FQN50_000220 [Emmonsiellopsis sp. PD_5]